MLICVHILKSCVLSTPFGLFCLRLFTDLINTVYIYTYIYIKLVHKEIYILLKIIYLIFTRVSSFCFLQRTFNDFSDVVFDLCCGHCFDGVVIPFNSVIDSL